MSSYCAFCSEKFEYHCYMYISNEIRENYEEKKKKGSLHSIVFSFPVRIVHLRFSL